MCLYYCVLNSVTSVYLCTCSFGSNFLLKCLLKWYMCVKSSFKTVILFHTEKATGYSVAFHFIGIGKVVLRIIIIL